MDWHQRIAQDPKILCGKPVVKGTRISVELILEELGAGWTEADILAAHPSLRAEDIRAACAYAARHLSLERLLAAEDASA